MLKHAKFSYDKETDKVYFFLRKGPAVDSIQVNENIRVEFDEEGNIIGIEISNILNVLTECLSEIVEDAIREAIKRK
jgi:uncharacterized protein YuzE